MRQLSYIRKEYVGNNLKPVSDDHDDYPDSLGLACMPLIATEEFEVLSDENGNLLTVDSLFG